MLAGWLATRRSSTSLSWTAADTAEATWGIGTDLLITYCHEMTTFGAMRTFFCGHTDAPSRSALIGHDHEDS